MDHIWDIEKAGREATKKSGAFYKKGDPKAEGLMATGYQYFLENWDNERVVFKTQLFTAGYKTEWYKAPYHWRMHKRYDGGSVVTVTYVEGDIKVETNDPRENQKNQSGGDGIPQSREVERV